MDIQTALTALWPAGQSETYTECRHCGTALETGDTRCPECGATELSHYELSATPD